jgi:septum formation protein
MSQIYLASASPRRRELLNQIGIQYQLLSVDVHEQQGISESAESYVQRVALDKARAGWQSSDCGREFPVMGADTEVVLEQRVLGKPESREHALEMLSSLSGRSHSVLSAVALVYGGREQVVMNSSVVHFRVIQEIEMESYWRTGEPRDKAGGYAIQGQAAVFISHLQGSFSGVMGLPLYEAAQLLCEFGVCGPVIASS